ncbi:hypothetical protein PUN28_006579 [Cardiocondyla obscurior]|uniref:Uncharacterized protein n=1 Tax=Cardiocondyla obscurior TaxID=286306 RepID=A0AAW2GC56_9HYME
MYRGPREKRPGRKAKGAAPAFTFLGRRVSRATRCLNPATRHTDARVFVCTLRGKSSTGDRRDCRQLSARRRQARRRRRSRRATTTFPARRRHRVATMTTSAVTTTTAATTTTTAAAAILEQPRTRDRRSVDHSPSSVLAYHRVTFSARIVCPSRPLPLGRSHRGATSRRRPPTIIVVLPRELLSAARQSLRSSFDRSTSVQPTARTRTVTFLKPLAPAARSLGRDVLAAAGGRVRASAEGPGERERPARSPDVRRHGEWRFHDGQTISGSRAHLNQVLRFSGFSRELAGSPRELASRPSSPFLPFLGTLPLLAAIKYQRRSRRTVARD